MIYTIGSEDQQLIDALTWARTQYNRDNSDAQITDDTAYLQWLIFEQAAPSYAKQQQLAIIQDAVAKAPDLASLTALATTVSTATVDVVREPPQ